MLQTFAPEIQIKSWCTLAFSFKLKTLAAIIACCAVIAVLSLSARFTGAYAVYFNGTPRLVPIYSVERQDKKISVTFDCAWGVEHTESILSALKSNGVRATFFAVEFWVEKYPEYVKKVVEAGAEFGTHSATHSHMSKQSADEIENELTSSAAALESVTGEKVELFRAPYGDYDDELIKTASNLGLYTIQWDVDSLDWKDLSANDIAMRVINRVQSGSIILMHNNGLHTAEAVPIIITTLKNRGYEFVPVSELIYRENYIIDAEGRQRPSA